MEFSSIMFMGGTGIAVLVIIYTIRYIKNYERCEEDY